MCVSFAFVRWNSIVILSLTWLGCFGLSYLISWVVPPNMKSLITSYFLGGGKKKENRLLQKVGRYCEGLLGEMPESLMISIILYSFFEIKMVF